MGMRDVVEYFNVKYDYHIAVGGNPDIWKINSVGDICKWSYAI